MENERIKACRSTSPGEAQPGDVCTPTDPLHKQGPSAGNTIRDPNRLTVGAMAQLNCVSARTLRIYDEKGLLVPACRDDETGYRYYTLAQCETLDTIQLLQRLGFALDEIKDVIANRDVPGLFDRLCAKEEGLDRQLGELKRLKYLLRRLKDRCMTAQSDIECGVCRVEALPQRRAIVYDLPEKYWVHEGKGSSAEQLLLWQMAICQVKRELIDSGVSPSYFGNVACHVKQDALQSGSIDYTSALIFIDNRDIDVSVPTTTIPASLYMTMYCTDRSCDEGELAETRCLHTLLDHIAETGYEITGDYVGEVVLDSELFSFSGRDELIKLQVPVRKRA